MGNFFAPSTFEKDFFCQYYFTNFGNKYYYTTTVTNVDRPSEEETEKLLQEDIMSLGTIDIEYSYSPDAEEKKLTHLISFNCPIFKDEQHNEFCEIDVAFLYDFEESEEKVKRKSFFVKLKSKDFQSKK
jgi:hypothetical protein